MANRIVLLSALFSLTAFPLLRAQIPTETGTTQMQQGQSSGCSNPLLAAGEDCLQAQQSSGAMAGGANGIPVPASLGYVPPDTTNPSSSSYEDGVKAAERWQQQPLPPDLPTEFQKFIAETTGQFLPLYGEDLFHRVPSTFAPSDQTPVPPEYVIGPEDELRVRIWGQVSFTGNLRVDRSGDIYLPQIGNIQVAGLPFSA